MERIDSVRLSESMIDHQHIVYEWIPGNGISVSLWLSICTEGEGTSVNLGS